MKKIVGIVGKKLSHSLSPTIHNTWIKKHKINAEYVCFEVKEEEIGLFYKDFKKNDSFIGFNVTVPYKENFFHMCNNVSKRAKSIGSLNLIFKKNNLIYGENTDYIGFKKIYEKIVKKKINNILVIGAGGAARPILKFLNNQKLQHIDILARTTNKKDSLSKKFMFNNFYTETNTIIDNKYDLILNTSDAGMTNKKQLDKNIYKMIQDSTHAIDIIYSPLLTKFLLVAQKAGVPNIGGLDMLLEQAKPSFSSWFKTDPEITKYLRKKLIKCLSNE